MPDDRFRLFPVLLLLGIGISFGTAVNFAKYALNHGRQPLDYLFWVMTGAALISWVVCQLRGRPPRLERRHLRYYLVIGGLHITVYHVVWFTVVAHIPAGIMSVIIGSSPITTYTLCMALRIERFAMLRLCGVVCGLAGFLLFVIPGQSLPDPSMAGWVLLGLGAPAIYAVSNVLMLRLRPVGGDSGQLSVGTLLSGALLTLPVALTLGQFRPPGLEIGGAEWAMIGHMVVGGLGFALLLELVRISGPVFASQITYVMALSGVAVGMLLFGEQPSLFVWAATALVLGGVGLVNLRPPRAR